MTGQMAKRARAGAALLLALAIAAGCDVGDKLLKAKNPAAIDEGSLNDPKLVDVLVNSAIGELQQAYADPFIWRGSMLTDEQVTGINWEQTARINQRILPYGDGDADVMYRELQRFRAVADSGSELIRGLVKDPSTDIRLAKDLAYAGYAYILMGEALCGANISRGGQLGTQVYTPDELTEMAIPKLQEALTIALATSDPEGPRVANLARVGLARANLQLGKMDEVKKYAAQVPADFVWWVAYSNNSEREQNPMYGQTHGTNKTLGVHPHFLLYGAFGTQGQTNQTDPRIQYTPNWSTGHNQLTKLYVPYASLPYSTYNGQTQANGGKPAEIQLDTDIKLASGLEAQHDYAEADGPTAATLAFVNARRAYGNQPPVDLSGDALMAELREQRGRDLYMGGFRLGDIRRWKKLNNVDLFPTGPHVNATWGDYGTATCFPIPLQEYNGNPDLPNPNK
ncbi:MAG: RagB/SusD family nutrient uptake outer membrane protein [Gemmatimonadetes bacterium]|nr:RagB/SusD family nutrient uptake outer membrane protein [Gemmatimonadota bacterium]